MRIREKQIFFLSLCFIAIVMLLLSVMIISISYITDTKVTLNNVNEHTASFELLERMGDASRDRVTLLRETLADTESKLDNAYNTILISGIAAVFLCVFIGGMVIIKTKNILSCFKRTVREKQQINEELELEIQDRERHTAELSKSETLERVIRDSALDSIITIDNKGIIQSCNYATSKMFGYEKEELIGNNVSKLMLDTYAEKHAGYLSRYLQTGDAKIIGVGRDLIAQRKDMSTIPVELGITEVKFDNEHLFVGVIHDTTQRRLAEEQLIRSRVDLEKKVGERTKDLRELNKQLSVEVAERKKAQSSLLHKATHDSLTGLVNRALFYEQLNLVIEQARRRNMKVALFFMDLDGFKQVNDTMGHDTGDQLLVEVSQRIKTVVRAEDIVARLGGDEFAIIFGHIEDEKHIESIAEKIIKSISAPFKQRDGSLTITTVGVSIGISIFPFDSDNSDALVKCADMAMYQAKEQGKGQYVFYPASKRSVSAHKE